MTRVPTTEAGNLPSAEFTAAASLITDAGAALKRSPLFRDFGVRALQMGTLLATLGRELAACEREAARLDPPA